MRNINRNMRSILCAESSSKDIRIFMKHIEQSSAEKGTNEVRKKEKSRTTTKRIYQMK